MANFYYILQMFFIGVIRVEVWNTFLASLFWPVCIAYMSGKCIMKLFLKFLKTNTNKSTMYGADIDPILANVEAVPTATFRTMVGNNSAVYK